MLEFEVMAKSFSLSHYARRDRLKQKLAKLRPTFEPEHADAAEPARSALPSPSNRRLGAEIDNKRKPHDDPPPACEDLGH